MIFGRLQTRPSVAVPVQRRGGRFGQPFSLEPLAQRQWKATTWRQKLNWTALPGGLLGQAQPLGAPTPRSPAACTFTWDCRVGWCPRLHVRSWSHASTCHQSRHAGIWGEEGACGLRRGLPLPPTLWRAFLHTTEQPQACWWPFAATVTSGAHGTPSSHTSSASCPIAHVVLPL